MRLKRGILISVAVASVVAPIAACGSGGGSSANSKTLTYWASQQGTSIANDKKVLKPVLKKFHKQTGIKVKLDVIDWNHLQNKIQTAASSGKAPDVINIGNTWGASLQSTGAFLKLNHDNMKAIGGADKFVKPALQAGGKAGKTPTSVPLYGLAYGLYYNKKMFADAQLKPPATWGDLTKDAKKLTKGKVHGMSIAGGSYTENAHFSFINSAQNGGKWFDPQGKPSFVSQENVNGIKRYLDLMQSDKAVSTSDSQYDESTKSINDFANHKSAMILNQNNADSSIKSQGMKSDEYGVVPFPAPKSGKSVASHVAGINMSVFKNTHNKSAALKFVKYMTSPKTQKTLDKPYAALPVLKSAAEHTSGETKEKKTFLDIYNHKSKPMPRVPNEDQFESTVGKAVNKMFSHIAGGKTVSESDIRSALKTAQDKVSSNG